MIAGAAFPVEDSTQVSTVRRAAQRLSERLSFDDARAGRLALVVTELGTNLVKHARRGEMLVQPVGDASGDDPGIEILALDRGPGIPDVALSRTDGFSTTGTLGHGLGAIDRQSDVFEIYTQPAGTAILARVLREGNRRPSLPRFAVGAVRVNAADEQVCGDDWMVRIGSDRLAAILIDGLGHGLQAHDAARAAIDTFAQVHDKPPVDIVRAVHEALRSTRGAAVAVLAADLPRRAARYCGVGNISGLIVAGGVRQSLVSLNGTAGHATSRLQEFDYAFPAGAMLVMHSDGVSTHWDVAAYPGLRGRHPSLVAAVLYRDHSRRRDDATVVVVKERPQLQPVDGGFP